MHRRRTFAIADPSCPFRERSFVCSTQAWSARLLRLISPWHATSPACGRVLPRERESRSGCRFFPTGLVCRHAAVCGACEGSCMETRSSARERRSALWFTALEAPRQARHRVRSSSVSPSSRRHPYQRPPLPLEDLSRCYTLFTWARQLHAFHPSRPERTRGPSLRRPARPCFSATLFPTDAGRHTSGSYALPEAND